MKAYLLTTQFNDYDQHGEYFVAWFHKKPSFNEVLKTLENTGNLSIGDPDNEATCRWILNGGGRTESNEYQWFYLREVPSESAKSATDWRRRATERSKIAKELLIERDTARRLAEESRDMLDSEGYEVNFFPWEDTTQT